MEFIKGSIEKVGYEVYIANRGPFRAFGFTTIVPPGNPERFWQEVKVDGRLKRLMNCSSVPTNLLGAGTWDEECSKKGFRYTICIEETENTDFAVLYGQYTLHEIRAGATDWMCFKTTRGEFKERFWKQDDPYKMMKVLGYKFHTGSYEVGFHFDVYPPHSNDENDDMEFWITVKQP